MMDRDEKDNLPKMQIGFIDSICLPLYRVSFKNVISVKPQSLFICETDWKSQALSESFPWVKPIYETCLANREQWKRLADLVDMGLTWIDHSFIEKPVEQIIGDSYSILSHLIFLIPLLYPIQEVKKWRKSRWSWLTWAHPTKW